MSLVLVTKSPVTDSYFSAIEVSTSDEYGHHAVPGLSLIGKTELKFEVKSTGDVFVSLIESESDSSQ